MRYNPVTGSYRQVSNYVETPLSVSLKSMLYQTTGSISLTNTLYDINMLISYNKVACIKQDVAEAVRKKVQDNSGVFIPSCITLLNNVVFVIDNTDWQIDIPDDQRQLHGTVITIFQEGEIKVQQQKMEIEKISRLQKKSDQMQLYPPLFRPDPKKEKAEYFPYTSSTGTLVFRKPDIV